MASEMCGSHSAGAVLTLRSRALRASRKWRTPETQPDALGEVLWQHQRDLEAQAPAEAGAQRVHEAQRRPQLDVERLDGEVGTRAPRDDALQDQGGVQRAHLGPEEEGGVSAARTGGYNDASHARHACAHVHHERPAGLTVDDEVRAHLGEKAHATAHRHLQEEVVAQASVEAVAHPVVGARPRRRARRRDGREHSQQESER
jgi:hypothetical protein